MSRHDYCFEIGGELWNRLYESWESQLPSAQDPPFTQFFKIIGEIQLLIWGLSVLDATSIEISTRNPPPEVSFPLFRPVVNYPLLHVNRASREVALERLRSISDSDEINSNLKGRNCDVLYFPDFARVWRSFRNVPHIYKAQRIVIANVECSKTYDVRLRIHNKFPNLQEVLRE